MIGGFRIILGPTWRMLPRGTSIEIFLVQLVEAGGVGLLQLVVRLGLHQFQPVHQIRVGNQLAMYQAPLK